MTKPKKLNAEQATELNAAANERFHKSHAVLTKLHAWRDWYTLYPLDRLEGVVSEAQEAADAQARARKTA
jgi:hypothetical protein